jgi:hypothetical protein
MNKEPSNVSILKYTLDEESAKGLAYQLEFSNLCRMISWTISILKLEHVSFKTYESICTTVVRFKVQVHSVCCVLPQN